MLDNLAKYDIHRPVYIAPHGGSRTGAGRKHGWKQSSYPLKPISLPPHLVAAIILARNTHVDEDAMTTAIKNTKKTEDE